MTLLSPLALLFALTAAVPLLLHLYQRRRRIVLEFSTTRFFTAAIVRSQRRMRLRRLLLLILRMAACVLLALALARPITTLAGLGHGGRRDVVILLDDSLSMQATESDGTSRFDSARRLATEFLRNLASGDQAAIITFTGGTLGRRTGVGVELTDDLLGLLGEIGRLEPTLAAGDAHAALARATDLLQAAGPRHRRLVIVSDLQESDWRQTEWPAPPHAIGAALVRLNPPTADNVAVEQVMLSQGSAVVGQPNLLRVRLVNYREEASAVELALQVDGREHVRRPIELGGGRPHVESIPLTFALPGPHRIELRADVHDALPADNRLYFAVDVRAQLPVLLVDGEADVRTSAALYLRAALQALGTEGDSVQLQTASPAELAGAALDHQRVVILSGVRDLPNSQVERLEQYVAGGGALAVFPGPGADREFYNQLLGGADRPRGGLLPAELHEVLDTAGAEQSLSLVAADVAHPMLQRFQGPLRGALAGIDVYRAYTLVPRQAWTVASLGRSVAADGTGGLQLPLIVERSYGDGRVLLFAVAPEPSWTNLPLRRSFLPLVGGMVSYLAGGGGQPGDHQVGEELVVLRGGWNPDQPVSVVRPDGLRLRAAVRTRGAEPLAVLPPESVDQPGFYELDPPGETSYAVNVPRSESIPRQLDLDAARRLAGNWRLDIVDSPARGGILGAQATAAVLAGGPAARGLWDALLWIVLLVVLIEPPLANRLAGLVRGSDAPARRAVA